MRTRRIAAPLVFLLITLFGCIALFLLDALSNPSIIRQFRLQPLLLSAHFAWWRYCVMHPPLLKFIFRCVLGCMLLSSVVTLAALCSGEPSKAVRKHLKNVGLTIFTMTAGGMLLMLPVIGQVWYGTNFTPHSLAIRGSLQTVVNSLMIDAGEVALVLGILSLIGVVLVYTLGALYARLWPPVLTA